MRLIRFTTADSPNPRFGVVVRDHAVPFAALEKRAGRPSPHLAGSRSYLANLPDSGRAAQELFAWGEELDAGRALEVGNRAVFAGGKPAGEAGA